MWIQNSESINTSYKNKNKMLYFNLIDAKNSDLRFSLLNGEIKSADLVKMKAEELAPSELKNKRSERQNKYFKEQVLVTDDNKITTKSHKGENIIVVNPIGTGGEGDMDIELGDNNKEPIVEQDDALDNLINTDKINKDARDKDHKDDVSDRASWSIHSEKDDHLKKVSSTSITKDKLHKADSGIKDKIEKSERAERSEANLISLAASSKKKKDSTSFVLLNISKNAQDFCNSLEEFTFVSVL